MPSTTTAEAKATLRRALSQLPPAGWEELTQAFLALPEVAQADTILVFYGVGREPDTRPAIRALLERGKRVALPKCLPGRRMQARAVSGLDKLTPGPFRIPEDLTRVSGIGEGILAGLIDQVTVSQEEETP